MPDTRTWDAGGSDGTWSTAVNWSDNTSPIDGDDVLFNDTADVAVTDPDSAPGFTPALFFVGDGYTKDIGTSADNRLRMNATKMIHRGQGKIWQSFSENIFDVIVHHTGSRRNLALDLWHGEAVGFKRLIVSRGRVLVTGVNPSDLLRDLIAVSGREAELTFVKAGVLSLKLLAVVDGILDLDVVGPLVNDVYVSGGTLTINGSSSGGFDRVTIANGGRVILNASVLIGTAFIMDGVLDFKRTQIKRTITTVNLWPKGEFKYFPDLTTITNPINEFDGRSVAP